MGITKLYATSVILAVSMLTACTNPTTTAGNTSTYFEGKITAMEAIDLKNGEYDDGSNTILGAVGGAILGNLISKNTTGTAVGAGVGAIAGNAASKYADRTEGVRLTIDSDSGPMVIDMPFSCKYKVGRKVRILSSGSRSSVMVYVNGQYRTATQDDYKKCPSQYYKIKADAEEY
ncbi:MAG: glycine zipper domain-containing protein [Succinivibrio sp.]